MSEEKDDVGKVLDELVAHQAEQKRLAVELDVLINRFNALIAPFPEPNPGETLIAVEDLTKVSAWVGNMLGKITNELHRLVGDEKYSWEFRVEGTQVEGGLELPSLGVTFGWGSFIFFTTDELLKIRNFLKGEGE